MTMVAGSTAEQSTLMIGELPETARINETAVDIAMEGDGADDDIGIDFDEI